MNRTLLVILLALAAAGIGVGVYYGTRKKEVVAPKKPEIEETQHREKKPVPKVRFTDITEKAGIHFKHENGAFGLKLLPETMGAGVAFIDYDNDGKQDILFINSRPWPGDDRPAPTMKLYHNLGDGKFEDVTEKMGLAVPLYGMGVCIGDVDNDGWPDIFITAIGGNKLFHNDGGRKFTDVTEKAGLAGGAWPAINREDFLKLDKPIPWPSSATFLDFDGDGQLDLFVCHYVTWAPKIDLDQDFRLGDSKTRAYGPPKSFEGSHCILYRNKGDGTFEDVSAKAGIQVFDQLGIGQDARQLPAAKALGVIVGDPDEDGWPDIVVANDTVRNFFFHNVPGPNGTRKFEEIGIRAGLGLAEGNARGGMGIDCGVILPDMCAVVVANFANESTTFYCQDKGKRLRFSDLAVAVGLSGPTLSPLKFGTFFFDYDLDGRLDMLTNNGHLEPDIEKLQKGQRYAQPPQMFWNTGTRSGCFEPVTEADAGSDLFQPLVGRGSAFADIDGNGTLDVVITSNGGPARLLRNDCDLKHHWIRLTLAGDGKRSNTSAIGAVVTLEAGGQVQTRTVTSGRGYLSQSELPVTFGLGTTDKIDKITIKWPGKDAKEQVLEGKDLEIDKMHSIKQK